MLDSPEALKVKVGPLAYVISGFRAMRGRRIRVMLTFDDQPPLRRRTRTVVVGNSGTLLGGLVLALVEQFTVRYAPIPPGYAQGVPLVLLIFFLAQKVFIEGVTLTGSKG